MQVIRIFLITLIFITLCTPAHALILVISSSHPNFNYDDIELGIFDPTNLYSGVDINNPSGPTLKHSPYFEESSGYEGRDDEDATRITNYIHGTIPDGTSVNLKLMVFGTKLNTYILTCAIGEQKNDIGREIILSGFIDAGQIRYYEIAYVPFQPPIIKKVATTDDLIADINTANKLGFIGNSKFVNELIKEVQEIEMVRQAHHDRDTELQKPDEKNRSQGDKEKEHLTPTQKAIKEYKELLKEITEKYQHPEGNEFIKQEAYTVLKEDLDYIIGHIQ